MRIRLGAAGDPIDTSVGATRERYLQDVRSLATLAASALQSMRAGASYDLLAQRYRDEQEAMSSWFSYTSWEQDFDRWTAEGERIIASLTAIAKEARAPTGGFSVLAAVGVFAVLGLAWLSDRRR